MDLSWASQPAEAEAKVNLDRGTSWMNNEEEWKDEVWKVCEFTIRNQISCFIALEGFVAESSTRAANVIVSHVRLQLVQRLHMCNSKLRMMINYCINWPLTCNSHVLDIQFVHQIEDNLHWTMTSVPIQDFWSGSFTKSPSTHYDITPPIFCMQSIAVSWSSARKIPIKAIPDNYLRRIDVAGVVAKWSFTPNNPWYGHYKIEHYWMGLLWWLALFATHWSR